MKLLHPFYLIISYDDSKFLRKSKLRKYGNPSLMIRPHKLVILSQVVTDKIHHRQAVVIQQM